MKEQSSEVICSVSQLRTELSRIACVFNLPFQFGFQSSISIGFQFTVSILVFNLPFSFELIAVRYGCMYVIESNFRLINFAKFAILFLFLPEFDY